MADDALPADLAARVEGLLGSPIASARRVTRGYTQAERWVVRTTGGDRAFVKAAVNEQTATWLSIERRMYEELRADVLPRCLGGDGGERPILILEDLSDAHWPPPWGPDRVAALRKALAGLHLAPVPDGLPSAEAERDRLDGWPRVAADPAPFLALGVVSKAWLSRALPTLREASRAAVLGGEAPLHFDVRSDNVAFAGGRTLLVDWNWTCRGNPSMDLACWLPSLHVEGGPPPHEVWTDGPEIPALVAGYFASVAGLSPPFPGSTVRGLQRAQLGAALPWAALALNLPPPG
jgi:hypothetical protein